MQPRSCLHHFARVEWRQVRLFASESLLALELPSDIPGKFPNLEDSSIFPLCFLLQSAPGLALLFSWGKYRPLGNQAIQEVARK